MPKISLTDFVDFVVKSGTPKLTKVRQLKNRGEYSPATDFWRPLRKAIIDFHKKGDQNKKYLDKILRDLNDEKKKNRYPEAIIGYKKFLGRKKTQWFDPPKEEWSRSGLDVRINPELGLFINGERYIVKLYFKDKKLAKQKITVILSMMEETLRELANPSDKFAILDVSNSSLLQSSGKGVEILPLLVGEASSFVTIWNNIE